MARLLLVDNDERITDLVRWFLERRGHEVSCASSYREARTRLQELRYELLLADLELGEESGREELKRLSDEGSLPPTLVVSGYLDAEIARELERIPNVLGTLSKPFDLNDLEGAIAGALEPRPTSLQASDTACTIVPVAPAPFSESVSVSAPKPAFEEASPPDSVENEEQGADTDEEDGWIEIVPLGGEPGDGMDDGPIGSDR